MDAELHDPRHPGTDDAGTDLAPTTGTRRVRGRTLDGQLRLLNTAAHPEWQLDETTRAVGRRGVAQARAALRAARGDHDAPAAASSRRSDAA